MLVRSSWVEIPGKKVVGCPPNRGIEMNPCDCHKRTDAGYQRDMDCLNGEIRQSQPVRDPRRTSQTKGTDPMHENKL